MSRKDETGTDISESSTVETVQEQQSKPEVVSDEGVDSVVHNFEAAALKELKSQKKVRIRIPSGRGTNERSAVFLGLQGQGFLIKRDEDVEVPVGIINVLKDAVELVPEVVRDSTGGTKTVFKKVPRHSFQILGPAEE